MATTAYNVNHPLAVKIWSRKLFQESLKRCWISKFIGTSDNALLQIKGETQKSAGDKITFGLRMQLAGSGVQGDGTLEGNEEALTVYNDSVLINQIRHAVRTDGRMSEQRVLFDIREEARTGLQDWWADRLDTCFFNQLGGNTAVTDTKYTGNNATIAPTATTNYLYANDATTETQVASASASNVFKLTFIDRALEFAKTNSPLIRPIRIEGDEYYVCFLHPYQVTDLRTASTSAGTWYDIQKAAMTGGQVKDNPIFSGALGMYNKVILHESNRVPAGLVAGTRRAIFCGAQAAVMGYGQDNSENKMTWNEEEFDYSNQLGVSAGMIFGMKKSVFNSQDFGTIVISTYAAAH